MAGYISGPSRTFARLLTQALLLGLIFGILEAVEIAILRPVPWVQPMTKSSLDVIWVAPLVHVTLNASMALALWFVARTGLPIPETLPPALFAFIGALAVATYSGFIGTIASIALAAGIAVQTARVLVRRTVPALERRAVIGLALLVVAGTATVHVVRAWPPDAAHGRVPPPGAPNVLIVVMDTVRADRLSAYGYRRPTPVIDQLAAEGTLFEWAIATSSWTLPSHASLLTGLPQNEHGADSVNSVLGPGHQQLQQRFEARGYQTGAFVANNIFFIPERGFGPGFQVFDVHYLRSLAARTAWGRVAKRGLRRFLHLELDPFRTAGTINAAFDHWRRGLDGRPFFAVLNYMDAHEPYHPGTRPANLRLWDRRAGRTTEENNQLSTDYDDAIGAMDVELGRLIATARQEQWWDNTVFVLLSDHGEAIADGSFDHGNGLTLEQIHVPLVLRYPGRVPAGMRVSTPVSLVDVPSTIEALVGRDAETSIPGAPLLTQNPASTSGLPVLSELVDPNRSPSQHLRAVVMDGYEYIHNVETATDHLFALSDVAGLKNLAASPEHRDVLARMQAALKSRVSSR